LAPQADLREAARLDREGKCAEAEPYYQRALGAGNPSAALLNNAGNHYLLCDQPGKARVYFERVLKANPSHSNANLQLARIDAGEGKKDAALRRLQKLEAQTGGDPALQFALGSAYARLGEYGRAETVFHAVLAARPADFDVLVGLGRAAARAGHHDRARTALETALKIRPADVDALTELGLVHAATQDYSRAVYLLAQARQNAPRRPDILLALARAAEDAGYYGDAALAYDEYVRLRPGDDSARRDRGRVLGYTGTRLEEGLAEMAAYIAQHPNDPIGYFNLAQFSWRTNPEESLQQLATAVRLDPKLAAAHVARAWLLHRLGRSAEAVSHLKAALEVAPAHVRALDQLGLVYLSLDRPQDAEAVLRQAVVAAPEDPDAQLHLGRALMVLGREEEARQFLDRYQKLRPRRQRDPRREPGMIQSATLSDSERRAREIERFRGMSRARPDDPLLQMHLASLLLAHDRREEAATEFRRLLASNAEASTWEQAGRALVQAEQFELAREFLERAAAERPGARLDLAIALFHTAGSAPALKILDEIPEDGRTGDFLLVKARILDAAGRSEEAEKLLTAGLGRTSVRPEIVQQAAMLLARRRRGEEALDLLARTPDHPEIALTRAIVLALLNRDTAAGKLLESIESRWPEWDRPYLLHGLLLERAQKGKQAVEKLRTAMALGSQDLGARCALARLSSSPLPNPQCDCLAAFENWVFPSCGP
jgi:tetratricopeptide (TPR) repeat protein